MNYREFFAIVNRLKSYGFEVEREDVITSFTNGAKNSLTQLTAWEYKELILWLNRKFGANPPIRNKCELQRRKIIAMLSKIGYVKDGKADMQRIYAWVQTHGYLHKHMNEYNESEIPRLVYQAEQFYKSHIDRL